jgi:isocitrate dehydrogenase
MIDSRGTKVYPGGFPETLTGDTWRCRFAAAAGGTIDHGAVLSLLGRVRDANIDFIKIETLSNYDGQAGYSLGQGQ